MDLLKCFLFSVVIDRRKDPLADTGLFELIFKQNFPRTPPYLGMNLSVRGRRIFRNRSRSKIDKEKTEKEKALLRLKKHDFIKNEFLKDSTISKMLPNIHSPDSYRGPIIADFIEELNKTAGDNDSGIDFVPVFKVDKKRPESKAERVSKTSAFKAKTNTSSVPRKQNAKENIRKSCKACNSNKHAGVLGVWAEKDKISSDSIKRNNQTKTATKETPSILKGKNIICALEEKTDINKNCLRIPCLSTFDLNKLLPQMKYTDNDNNH